MNIENALVKNDATELGAQVQRGDFSPLELIDASIARAERLNPKINAIAEPLFEQARTIAKTTDRRLPFAGVPIAVKDLGAFIANVPMHGGSTIKPQTREEHSLIVSRWLAAGFIPIATSTSPEWGLRLVTETKRFGATRNPWDLSRTPAGSSGGSAALVAAGIVPIAHASDGGGSIRAPAAATGLVGLKPTTGLVPLAPFSETGWQAWHGLLVQNAFTRSVRDSAAILDLATASNGKYKRAAGAHPGKLKIGVHRKPPVKCKVSKETHAALDETILLLKAAGHETQEIVLPFPAKDMMRDLAWVIAASQAANLESESQRLGASQLRFIERSTRIISRFGARLSGDDVQNAVNRLKNVTKGILEASAGFDCVLMPSLAHPPIKIGAMDPNPFDDFNEFWLDFVNATWMLRFPPLMQKLINDSFWFTPWTPIQNITGQPAINLPVYVSKDGLPLGVQLVGKLGAEDTLLSVAAQLEPLAGWLNRRAPEII